MVNRDILLKDVGVYIPVSMRAEDKLLELLVVSKVCSQGMAFQMLCWPAVSGYIQAVFGIAGRLLKKYGDP